MPPADLDPDDYILALDAIYGDAIEGRSAGRRAADKCVETELHLAPHRERADRLKEELETLRVCRRVLAAGLHLLGVAVFVLNDERRIIFANAAADVLRAEQTLFSVCGGLLAATDRTTDATLQKAIDAALDGRADRDGIYIRLTQRARPLAAIVVPTPRGRDEGAAAIVFVSNPSAQVDAGINFLVQAHSLTAGEARLMTALAAGGGLVAAAARLNIAPTTARTHLKHIFAKTQTERQSELMRLLATVAPPMRRSRQV